MRLALIKVLLILKIVNLPDLLMPSLIVGRPDTVFPIIKGENWGVTGPNISM